MNDSSEKPPITPEPKRSSTGYWVLLLVFILVLGAIAVGVANVRHQLKSEIKELTQTYRPRPRPESAL